MRRTVTANVVETSVTINTNSPSQDSTTAKVVESSVNINNKHVNSFFSFRNSAMLVYYGLTLDNSKLAGNKYLNFFIGGALEVVIVVMVMFILHRYRSNTLCSKGVMECLGMLGSKSWLD